MRWSAFTIDFSRIGRTQLYLRECVCIVPAGVSSGMVIIWLPATPTTVCALQFLFRDPSESNEIKKVIIMGL